MKTYNSTNFFKHTFCEFTQKEDFVFPEKTNYQSKSNSRYFYTDEGVYRQSNHWGRVANCKWMLIANKDYKNQKNTIGFAKWSDFYPINTPEKIFFIEVDFNQKTAKLQPKNEHTLKHFFFSYSEGQKRIKQIKQLFNETKWAYYFSLEINVLRMLIISEFINTDKTLQKIKKEQQKKSSI